eukprot:TRINITY_DN6851_c0_g1_i2.p1 TRINITY_DN6851_c0_g1~~TRINITY_DN6851_c0_g1_i2.p1  ORF type:complete len:324 (+),score=95.14 TRINITY_DN6851_c0_g1_i2:58-1029(+)
MSTKEFNLSGLGSGVLPVYRYDQSTKRWMDTGREQVISPQLNEEEGKNVEALKVVTYNVWFGDYKDVRIEQLLKEVKEERPDFIGFQEVTPYIVTMIRDSDWVQRDYFVTDTIGETVVPYGCLLLSRFKPISFEFHKFPTTQGRKLIMGKFKVNDRIFSVGTVHLESYPHQKAERKAQMEISFAQLGVDSNSSILMGDCNFPDGEENSRVPEEYVDSWRVIHSPPPPDYNAVNPKEDRTEYEINAFGYTFDPKRNQMTEPYPPSRIDRIFLRSRDWRVSGIKMLGTVQIPSQGENHPKNQGKEIPLWPSDHFGLSASLSLKNE